MGRMGAGSSSEFPIFYQLGDEVDGRKRETMEGTLEVQGKGIRASDFFIGTESEGEVQRK